jgi:hypothetical protein
LVEIAGTATGDGAVAALEACYRARNRTVPAAETPGNLTLAAATGTATDAGGVATLEAFDKSRYGTVPAAETAEAWTSVTPTGHVTDAGAEALLEDSMHCSRCRSRSNTGALL